MIKIKLRDIKKVETIAELESLGLGKIYFDIGNRGGGVGFDRCNIVDALDISEEYLPRYVGAGCNYLGGGMRGSITPSGYSSKITGRKAKILDELCEACIRFYKFIEDENGLNNEEYDDGDTNWDALGTKESRKAGIVSGY